MNSRERVIKVLNHEIPDRVPIYEAFIDRNMVNFAIGIEGKDSVALEADDLVLLHKAIELDAIMCPLNWKPREQMKNKKVPVSSVQIPEEMIEKALKRCESIVSKAHDEGLGAILYTHGCFDIPYEVLGFENYMMLIYDDFDYIEEVTEYFYNFYKKIVQQFIKLKPDVIMIGDDIAYNNGLMIRPDLFFKLWYEREKDLVNIIKSSGIPVEFHTDGNLNIVLPYLIDIGVDLVNPVDTNSNDIFELKEKYGSKIGLRGNIDIAGNLVFGTPEDSFEEARMKVSKLKVGGNYACSSSHSITSGVKPDNYLAVVRAVKEYGCY